MSTDLVAQIARAGEQITATPGPGIADELNRHLNQLLRSPFQAASGTAFDGDGLRTAPFGCLIFTRVQGAETLDGWAVNINADRLACAIDVTHTLDLIGLRQAYARIAHAKTLKKSPAARNVTHTTITFGVIFAVAAAVPLEQLADELDRLNRQTPAAHWPDMVVSAPYGLISYAVQFPGEALSGQWLPPAERALANYVPATYIVMIIKPSLGHTFNQPRQDQYGILRHRQRQSRVRHAVCSHGGRRVCARSLSQQLHTGPACRTRADLFQPCRISDRVHPKR